MELQKLYSYTRKAIDDYHMISDGDHIAVGVSGGKDSLTMLYALAGLRRFYPQHFEISAFTVDLGFEGFSDACAGIKTLCERFSVPYTIISTPIQEIIFQDRKEKNPCSLCANFRRGALNSVAIREGCNKIALGHNEDDVLETFLLNLLYTGTINTFSPVSYMDRSKITLIRPLIYAPEKYIKNFIKRNDIQVMEKVCPVDGTSKREDMKKMINDLKLDIPHIRANLYGAIKRNLEDWKQPGN